MFRRKFTVQEANDLVPLLEEVMERIDGLKEEVRRHYRKLQVLEALWGDDLQDPDNPDRTELLSHKAAVDRAVSEIEDLINDEIVDRGLRFPSGGLEQGLVDFPTTYEGRWILLCWQRGEPEVGYWHELNGGFAGRQEITTEQEALIGLRDAPF